MFTQASGAASETDVEARISECSSGTMPDRLLKPDSYDPAVHYPLVVALHGAWGRGTDNEI
jgi:predicted peptidase